MVWDLSRVFAQARVGRSEWECDDEGEKVENSSCKISCCD